MTQLTFPPLSLERWLPTRDTIHSYAQVIGKVRRTLSPPQKHWWHCSLHTTATGLTTTPIFVNNLVIELQLDFCEHRLLISTNQGERLEIPLEGQSPAEFCTEVCDALASWEIYPDSSLLKFADDIEGRYDTTAVATFWTAFSQIDAIFKTFKASLREETSPVQLWPHHFDLALLWLSGRLIPGQDPANAEYADEQMNFGFVTGDGGIPEPYFYATAYPVPAQFTESALPGDAYWHTEGWTGAVLPYSALVDAANPQEKLLTFLRTAHQAGTRHRDTETG
ncbi:MAG: hypothetical protein IAF02_23185 [Anaerolineae bacterium]|nr:hypothetical protein [Anaerolineae bacterium]